MNIQFVHNMNSTSFPMFWRNLPFPLSGSKKNGRCLPIDTLQHLWRLGSLSPLVWHFQNSHYLCFGWIRTSDKFRQFSFTGACILACLNSAWMMFRSQYVNCLLWSKTFSLSTVFVKCQSNHFQIGRIDMHLESFLVHTHSLLNDTVEPF